MSPLQVGDLAPAVDGVAFGDGPVGLFFYKVTCPVCQLAAPTMREFDTAFPGRVVGVGQDPVPRLATFTEDHAMGIASIEDPPPYAASDAYGVRTVPTLFLVGDDARVLDVVEAWDRDGYNRVATALAERLGTDPIVVSAAGDGLPDFKPG